MGAMQLDRARIFAAIALVAIMLGSGAFVWFRSRPLWILHDVGTTTLTPSGELLVATGDSSVPESDASTPHVIIARQEANGARTPIAKAYRASSMVASNSHVFWSERGDRGPTRVRGAPIAGGAVTDFGESTPSLLGIAASNDHVYWLKDTGDVFRDHDEIAHDALCIAADDAGAFAATATGVVRLDTGAVVASHATTGRCALLLSSSDVYIATWESRDSTLERAPRVGGSFEHVRTERRVASWYVVGPMFVWTSLESLGKGFDGYEHTEVLTHVARGNAPARVAAKGDTMWVGVSGDTIYTSELDGLHAARLR